MMASFALGSCVAAMVRLLFDFPDSPIVPLLTFLTIPLAGATYGVLHKPPLKSAIHWAALATIGLLTLVAVASLVIGAIGVVMMWSEL